MTGILVFDEFLVKGVHFLGSLVLIIVNVHTSTPSPLPILYTDYCMRISQNLVIRSSTCFSNLYLSEQMRPAQRYCPVRIFLIRCFWWEDVPWRALVDVGFLTMRVCRNPSLSTCIKITTVWLCLYVSLMLYWLSFSIAIHLSSSAIEPCQIMRTSSMWHPQ